MQVAFTTFRQLHRESSDCVSKEQDDRLMLPTRSGIFSSIGRLPPKPEFPQISIFNLDCCLVVALASSHLAESQECRRLSNVAHLFKSLLQVILGAALLQRFITHIGF